MTYITEFAVEGLAGRDDTYSQKLNRDVNIFFGLNGSGKTSLLKILHSAMQADTSIISRTPFRSAEVKFFSVNYNKVVTRTIKRDEAQEMGVPSVEDADAYTDVFWQQQLQKQIRFLSGVKSIEWKTRTKGLEKVEGFRHFYLPTSRLWFSPRASSKTEIYNEEQLDNFFQSMLTGLWSTYVGEVLSKVREAQEEGLANILKWILSSEEQRSKRDAGALDANTAFDRVKSFLGRQNAQGILGSREEFNRRYTNSVVLKNVVNYIDEVEVRIADAMSPRNKLQTLISDLFSGNKKVVLSDKSIDVIAEDKTQIGIASLSSGEKHFLRILVEVLHAEDNTLLIDEPEISMHIDWQKELISAMRIVNPNSQLIIATHSPEIMADIDDDKIFRL